MWRVLSVVFGGMCCLVGVSYLSSTASLMTICRTSCWLNGLVLALFGEERGKIAFAAIWMICGLTFVYRGLALKKK